MISFPNAKINLGLYITGKREDGFHNIETVFYPIELCDVLELIEASDGKFQFQSSGLIIPGDPDKNLCIQAYNLLASDFALPTVKIYLHKNIPTGAGLGGGSSNASHTLILLNQIFNLGICTEDLKNYARKLGSDCAFFIDNYPCYAFGKGDQFEAIELSLDGYYIVIIKPDFGVGTQEAYSGIELSKDNPDLKSIFKENTSIWKNEVHNAFEVSIFKKYPEIKQIKEQLYKHGAVYASMSGSGSAVYGIFKDRPGHIDFPESCFYWEGNI